MFSAVLVDLGFLALSMILAPEGYWSPCKIGPILWYQEEYLKVYSLPAHDPLGCGRGINHFEALGPGTLGPVTPDRLGI